MTGEMNRVPDSPAAGRIDDPRGSVGDGRRTGQARRPLPGADRGVCPTRGGGPCKLVYVGSCCGSAANVAANAAAHKIGPPAPLRVSAGPFLAPLDSCPENAGANSPCRPETVLAAQAPPK